MLSHRALYKALSFIYAIFTPLFVYMHYEAYPDNIAGTIALGLIMSFISYAFYVIKDYEG